MTEIYIVEDDDSIREMLVYALSGDSFKAEGFGDDTAFYAAMKERIPSLILLDIMLPGEDGISILKRLKQMEKYKTVPVIMLTAKGRELDRIKGLDLGADDYITKPFSVLEVISRIKAVLRRCGGCSESVKELKIGGVALNSDKRTVHAEGSEIPLTYKEFELLAYMMANQGIVLTRERLLNHVWGFEYGGESRTVDMHIRTLRQKLGVGGDIIKTVRNVGYKIEG